MAMIQVNNLTFSYYSHFENIFENTSFTIDTDWKLGFIGRNGRGKTTFLQLLLGKYTYSGTITSSTSFDYFPFEVNTKGTTLEVVRNIIAPFTKWECEMEACLQENTEKSLNRYGELLELYLHHDGYSIKELIEKEISKLHVTLDTLHRPFHTLSLGEQTKLMLAALFLKKNHFLLIDEPTNHLDLEGRAVVADYLNSKKGFILVSHDRLFLDQVIDHVLSINRSNIEIIQGNYSIWKQNKDRQDQYEKDENEKLKKEIGRLEVSSKKTAGWSDALEKTKIGGGISKGFIGHKSAKMMKRAKVIERRQERLIDEKSQLLKNIEDADALKIHPLPHPKKTLVELKDIQICYGDKIVCDEINFTLNQGDRIALKGPNGSGKSTLLKLLIGNPLHYTGKLLLPKDLIISYVPQDTAFLKGDMKTFIYESGIDESLFKAILRKLDFSRNAFDKDLNALSSGQKKKVLLAKSLSQKAHLYIWDEPLNYIDLLSRNQIEELLLTYAPTMIFVEHDRLFNETVATRNILLGE
jgi:lincosamide and streptogramin A transport system ATP-binding/permease protein